MYVNLVDKNVDEEQLKKKNYSKTIFETFYKFHIEQGKL